MDLFADKHTVYQLVTDSQTGIRWWPHAFEEALAAQWFSTLRNAVPWQALERPMYERIVAVPRLMATYWLQDLPAASPVNEMYQALMQLAPATYSAVQLNLYRDGRDSIAMHQDKLGQLMEGEPIALVSLGSTRRMTLRCVQGGGKSTSIGLDLQAGSLLVMSHLSQSTHEHGIAKTQHTVGERISVVFRARHRL